MFKLGSDSIIVLRAPLLLSPRGSVQRRDYTQATSILIRHCSVQDAGSTMDREDMRGREFAEGDFAVWMPPTAPEVLHTDRVLFNSRVYEPQGFARLWSSRLGRKKHWAFRMKRRQDTHVHAVPQGIPAALSLEWSIVSTGHGPPTEQIVGSGLYIDLDTGIYYVWEA